MRNHPLTPMRDADLVRVLARQCRGRVGLVHLATVEAGVEPTRARFAELARAGIRVAIADAVFDRHLDTLGSACADLPLVTGAAGLGRGLAHEKVRPSSTRAPAACFDPTRTTAVLSGSCAAATLAQVQRVKDVVPSRAIDPAVLTRNARTLPDLIEWACDQARHGDLLVYSTAEPDIVAEVQRQMGTADAATLVESAFGAIAAALAERGVRSFVVAGGETSGAVLEALRVRVVEFGADI